MKTSKEFMRAALVTGACGGIGQAICKVFLDAGYHVIGVDLQPGHGVPNPFIQFDIRQLCGNQLETSSFLERVHGMCEGKLEVLINNAALQIVKPFTELTVEDWQSTMDTNVMAPFRLTQLLYPQLKINGGCVVNIASIHANQTKKQFSAYATSKGALVTLTKALALELAPKVRINAILPAATDTPMLREGFEGNPDGLAALNSYHPLSRIARPKEIADLALFLSGSSAGFITGAAIPVDGGIGACLHDPA